MSYHENRAPQSYTAAIDDFHFLTWYKTDVITAIYLYEMLTSEFWRSPAWP